MRTQMQALLGITLASALVATAQAEIAGVQFSADMISQAPDGRVETVKMFVGDGRMRKEMKQQDQDVIQIIDQNRGMLWVLFPDQQTYLEQGGPPGEGGIGPAGPSAETDPCAGMQGLTCRRAGEDDVGGRKAVKWEMVMTREGQSMSGTLWIDAERAIPLKHEMSNGEKMELLMVGTDTIEGRQVEKWEMTTTAPNQQPNRVLQWYDPELKLSVREEFPGGGLRELKSIRIGAQPDHLFAVPAGYTRMEMPQPGSQHGQ
jgi:outer membrane lipoprotein-sorting protein